MLLLIFVPPPPVIFLTLRDLALAAPECRRGRRYVAVAG
jgi:hypothetical protein